MYRLLADVLNDIGFVLDCLSPAFPKPIRVIILSFSSVLRALCGVAAGSAKASLSAHFARWDNLGELNAKDSSQETVISLLGMLAGSFVVSWVTTPIATWTTLAALLSIHLETNRRAVRAVSMRTLNRQRATLVYHHLRVAHVPTPKDIAAEERIFESSGVLRAADGAVLGYCQLGSTFLDIFRAMSGDSHRRARTDILNKVLSMYKDSRFILWTVPMSRPRQVQTAIKESATTTDLLTAWWQALLVVSSEGAEGKTDDEALAHTQRSLDKAKAMLLEHQDAFKAAGWDLSTNALETRSSSRLVVDG